MQYYARKQVQIKALFNIFFSVSDLRYRQVALNTAYVGNAQCIHMLSTQVRKHTARLKHMFVFFARLNSPVGSTVAAVAYLVPGYGRTRSLGGQQQL